MSTPQHAFVTMVAVLALTVVAVYSIRLWTRAARPTTVSGADRLPAVPDDRTSPNDGLAQLLSQTTHRAPSRSFSVDEAHRTMQIHLTCRADSCARKRSALRCLVECGRVVPDLRAETYLRSG